MFPICDLKYKWTLKSLTDGGGLVYAFPIFVGRSQKLYIIITISFFSLQNYIRAVTTIEADEAAASSDFLKKKNRKRKREREDIDFCSSKG